LVLKKSSRKLNLVLAPAIAAYCEFLILLVTKKLHPFIFHAMSLRLVMSYLDRKFLQHKASLAPLSKSTKKINFRFEMCSKQFNYAIAYSCKSYVTLRLDAELRTLFNISYVDAHRFKSMCWIFKWLSQPGGWADIAETTCAS